MESAAGALLPLADWPVSGGNGGRCLNSHSGVHVSFRARTCCAKNEPAPRNVHLGGQLGFLASGGLAAVGCLTIVYPLVYARTRLASDVGSGKKTPDGLFDCLKKTASGPKGSFSFHAGFGVSLGGIIPYRGFQLGAFDTIVRLNSWKNDTGMMGFFSTFAAAQTAIIASVGISSPFDSVRRRLQMQAQKPVEPHIYKGTVDRLKKIAAEEGIAAGVHKGFVANALRRVGGARCWCSRLSRAPFGLGRLERQRVVSLVRQFCLFLSVRRIIGKLTCH